MKILSAEVLEGEAGGPRPRRSWACAAAVSPWPAAAAPCSAWASCNGPGKRALRAADFVNGERLRAGEGFS